jgi:hypothetical protein
LRLITDIAAAASVYRTWPPCADPLNVDHASASPAARIDLAPCRPGRLERSRQTCGARRDRCRQKKDASPWPAFRAGVADSFCDRADMHGAIMDTPAIDAVRFAEGRQTGSLEGPRAALLIQIQQQRRCPGNCAGGCSGRLTRALSMRSSSRTMTASSRSIADMRFWLMGTVTLLGRVAATNICYHKKELAHIVSHGASAYGAPFSKRDTRGLFRDDGNRRHLIDNRCRSSLS